MKKTIILVVLLYLLASLIGCARIADMPKDITERVSIETSTQNPQQSGGVTLTEESSYEIKAIANNLIFRADMLYQLFYGEQGFREFFGDVKEIEDGSGDIWLTTPKCESIEQLKVMAQSVFAEEYCQFLFQDVFEGDYNKYSYINSVLCESTQVGGIGNTNYMLMATMKIVSISDKSIVLQLTNDLPSTDVETTRIVEAEMVWEKEQWVLKKYPLEYIQ